MKIKYSQTLTLIFSYLLTLFLTTSPILASSLIPHKTSKTFTVDRQIVYTINSDLISNVQENITITNLTTEKYPQTYTTTISDFEIQNIYVKNKQNKNLKWKLKNNTPNNTSIIIDLPPVTGKYKSSQFTLYYDLPNSIINKNQTKEIKLPKLTPNPLEKNTTIRLLISKKLGQPAYILPTPQKQTSNNPEWYQFDFSPQKLQTSGLRAIFGNFQLYDFELKYYLSANTKTNSNPKKLLASNSSTIAIPPDTDYQKVAITYISEPPKNITIDQDGNWIANYQLQPKQTKTIIIKGTVMVFASPWKQTALPNTKTWIQPQQYWESNNPSIQELASSLSNIADIYQYVTQKLTYKQPQIPNAPLRQGAVQALITPNQSSCMEFTDLFIALARAKGYPTRQIIGYAHSDNPKTQPLSLVADILHSWPEYYDTKKQNWIPVDPTWQTTSGIDYFNNWDMNHITLVINGQSSTHPLSAGFYKQPNNPQRDVLFTLGTDFPPPSSQLKPKLKINYPWIPFSWWNAKIQITNPGPTSIANISPTYRSTKQLQLTIPKTKTITTLPPYATQTVTIKFKPQLFNLNQQINITLKNQTYKLSIPWTVTAWTTMILLLLSVFSSIILYQTYKIARNMRRLSIQK